MSSLFKRTALSLITAAAASTLCIAAQAVTATWDPCAPVLQTSIEQRVDCNFTGDAIWQKADFYTVRLGGGDSYSQKDDSLNMYVGGGDYYDPSSGYYLVNTKGGGTYNCWCNCSGLDYYNNAWAVGTGSTYISR